MGTVGDADAERGAPHERASASESWARWGTPMRSEAHPMSLLEVRDAVVSYWRPDTGPVRAVAGVDLTVEAGEILGLVGETGCGKSSLARAAVGLVPLESGSIVYDGTPVESLRRSQRPVG